MTTHDGHKLVYVYDRAVVETACTITDDGDVQVSDDPWTVVDVGGDGNVYCNTCDVRVYPGEAGLAVDWECVW